MKKILFDLFEAQPASTTKFHGGGEYIKAIFKNLVENYLKNVELIVFYNKDKFIDEWIIDIIESNHIKQYDIKNESDISKIFEKESIDTFYSGLPYYYKREWIPANTKTIGSIHGLRFLELPGDTYAHLYETGVNALKEKVRLLVRNQYRKRKQSEFKSCINMLDEIVCNTNHTYYSVKKWFHINKDIHLFCPPQKNAKLCTTENSPINNKFILLIGGDRWIKNVYRAVMALEILFDNDYLMNYKVVITGGLNKKIRKCIQHTKQYKIMDYVETEVLESLYKHCDIFLYPSLNEGFGMPPLEAMKYGTTCVVSGVCSLPEVCGDAVYYVNPYDIDEIAVRVLLASEKKIPVSAVEQQFKKIFVKQKEDLDKLCKFIIS